MSVAIRVPSRKQCAEIARATKAICDWSGFCHVVTVWPDFTWQESVDSNENTGLSVDATREIIRPLAILKTPMSSGLVREVISRELQAQA